MKYLENKVSLSRAITRDDLTIFWKKGRLIEDKAYFPIVINRVLGKVHASNQENRVIYKKRFCMDIWLLCLFNKNSERLKSFYKTGAF